MAGNCISCLHRPRRTGGRAWFQTTHSVGVVFDLEELLERHKSGDPKMNKMPIGSPERSVRLRAFVTDAPSIQIAVTSHTVENAVSLPRPFGTVVFDAQSD
jgi:hypothetical protein